MLHLCSPGSQLSRALPSSPRPRQRDCSQLPGPRSRRHLRSLRRGEEVCGRIAAASADNQREGHSEGGEEPLRHEGEPGEAAGQHVLVPWLRRLHILSQGSLWATSPPAAFPSIETQSICKHHVKSKPPQTNLGIVRQFQLGCDIRLEVLPSLSDALHAVRG